MSTSERSTPLPQESPSGRRAHDRRRVVIAIVVALIVFAGVAAATWSFTSSDSSSTNAAPTPAPGSETTPTAANVVPGIRAQIVSFAKLRELTGGVRHPVFWAGARPGARIEFTQTTDGSTYVRYLTGSAKAGTQRAGYVVVATYPQPDAYDRATKIARSSDYAVRTLPNGTTAITKPGRPQNIYVVSPGKPYQVEVFAPTAAQAQRLVSGGVIVPVS